MRRGVAFVPESLTGQNEKAQNAASEDCNLLHGQGFIASLSRPSATTDSKRGYSIIADSTKNFSRPSRAINYNLPKFK